MSKGGVTKSGGGVTLCQGRGHSMSGGGVTHDLVVSDARVVTAPTTQLVRASL